MYLQGIFFTGRLLEEFFALLKPYGGLLDMFNHYVLVHISFSLSLFWLVHSFYIDKHVIVEMAWIIVAVTVRVQ